MNKFLLSAACTLALVGAQMSAFAQTTVTNTLPATTPTTQAAPTSSTGNQPKQPLPGCKPSTNQPKKCRPSPN